MDKKKTKTEVGGFVLYTDSIPFFFKLSYYFFKQNLECRLAGQASRLQLKMFTFSKTRAKRTGRKHERGLLKISWKLNLKKMDQGLCLGSKGL